MVKHQPLSEALEPGGGALVNGAGAGAAARGTWQQSPRVWKTRTAGYTRKGDGWTEGYMHLRRLLYCTHNAKKNALPDGTFPPEKADTTSIIKAWVPS